MKRHNIILAVILAVQIGLSVVVFIPRSGGAAAGEPAFPGVEAEGIISLLVEDDSGSSVALAKVDDAWVLSEADDYPASADKVPPLLEKLAGLSTGRVVARTATSHVQLEVAEDVFQRRVTFEAGDGVTHTVYLGSSPQYGSTHFRLAGEDEVYLSADFSSWEFGSSPSTWIDTAYHRVERDDLVRVTLENAQGTFVFVKDDAGEWTLEDLAPGELLAAEAVTLVISRAATVTMIGPLGLEEDAAYGMDDPSAVVMAETTEGSFTLTVGAQDEEDESYVFKSSESDYYVSVAGYNAQPLVERGREDFLQDVEEEIVPDESPLATPAAEE